MSYKRIISVSFLVSENLHLLGENSCCNKQPSKCIKVPILETFISCPYKAHNKCSWLVSSTGLYRCLGFSIPEPCYLQHIATQISILFGIKSGDRAWRTRAGRFLWTKHIQPQAAWERYSGSRSGRRRDGSDDAWQFLPLSHVELYSLLETKLVSILLTC